jgi:hypothetical protein
VAEAARGANDVETLRQLGWWIVDEGAGKNVASIINLMFDKILLPEQLWDIAQHWLDVAVDLDEINEGTKALVNLGRIFIEKEELNFAKERLGEALDRVDKCAESEASFLLGTIALKESDPGLAKDYFERGARAEGEAQAEFAKKCRAQLNGIGNDTTQPVLCAQCGAKIAPEARFCSSCGSPVQP